MTPPAMRRHATIGERARIIRLRREGVEVPDIAALVGVTIKVVGHVLQKAREAK